MPNIGMTELIVILVIVVLLFGAKKIPELAKSLGKGIKDFKESQKELDGEKKSDSPDAAKK